jgi:hypothetical protein
MSGWYKASVRDAIGPFEREEMVNLRHIAANIGNGLVWQGEYPNFPVSACGQRRGFASHITSAPPQPWHCLGAAPQRLAGSGKRGTIALGAAAASAAKT